jgi:hypothetical protein
MSKKSEWISKKIEKLDKEGYTNPKQRIAIAFSMAEKELDKRPKKKDNKGKHSSSN